MTKRLIFLIEIRSVAYDQIWYGPHIGKKLAVTNCELGDFYVALDEHGEPMQEKLIYKRDVEIVAANDSGDVAKDFVNSIGEKND